MKNKLDVKMYVAPKEIPQQRVLTPTFVIHTKNKMT